MFPQASIRVRRRNHNGTETLAIEESGSSPRLVSVTMVTTNDFVHLPRCLASLRAQTYRPLEIVCVDNASTDGSWEWLSAQPDVRLLGNDSNRGFCAAQNRAIAASNGDWVLCLNPDTKLEPDCITELVRAGECDPAIGMVCPKILRMGAAEESGAAVLDSAGGYFTPWLRHHDRGSQQPDRGQYDRPQYVFCYTGAAVLFRRTMIAAVSIEGEFLDEDFFFYREDADLSWRAHLLGWKCLYHPRAVVHHLRRVFEGNRRSLPAAINLHSTKNRFLMRIKNITPMLYAQVFLPATLRDIAVLAYVLLRERSSLAGLWMVVRGWQRTLAKRRWIQERRKCSDAELARWFSFTPTALPLDPELDAQLARPSREKGISIHEATLLSR